MRLGAVIPLGGAGDYDGWDPGEAWAAIARLAQEVDSSGFDSVWLTDHFETVPVAKDEAVFESFSTLMALAVITTNVRLGHLVACAGFRNAALTAKMISTMDVISGGRMQLGIGAGWNRSEWLAYGYPFPSAGERLDALEDTLEVLTRMLKVEPGSRATYRGRHASVVDAINMPRRLAGPPIPIIVGGNGPNRTWRLAARYADEINLDDLSPDQVLAALPVIRQHCQEVGRDPTSLDVSVSAWWERSFAGHDRVEILEQYRGTGITRMMLMVRPDEGSVRSLVEDATAAGVEI